MNINNDNINTVLTWWSCLTETYEFIEPQDSEDTKIQKLIDLGKIQAYREILRELDLFQ